MQSNMSGFVSDEQDTDHSEAFPESIAASAYLKRNLPKDGDKLFFGWNTATDEWVIVSNRGGRLFIEIGEAAA